jgi:rubrerythrin
MICKVCEAAMQLTGVYWAANIQTWECPECKNTETKNIY